MDIETFGVFLFQMAVFVFSKGQNCLGHMPPAFLFQELMNHFRKTAQSKGQSTLVWDSPESKSPSDAKLVQYVTQKIEEDPCFKLPSSFSKHVEKRVKFEHVFPESLREQIKEPVEMAYEIMNDLLGELFQINLFEPHVRIKNYFQSLAIFHLFLDGCLPWEMRRAEPTSKGKPLKGEGNEEPF